MKGNLVLIWVKLLGFNSYPLCSPRSWAAIPTYTQRWLDCHSASLTWFHSIELRSAMKQHLYLEFSTPQTNSQQHHQQANKIAHTVDNSSTSLSTRLTLKHWSSAYSPRFTWWDPQQMIPLPSIFSLMSSLAFSLTSLRSKLSKSYLLTAKPGLLLTRLLLLQNFDEILALLEAILHVFSWAILALRLLSIFLDFLTA